MNIIQVGSYPLSADCIHGGVESSVYGLTQALVRKGYTVDVFDNPRIGGKDTSERKGLLTIHRYANNGRHNEDAMQRCKEIFRDIVALHPEIIHIHGTGKLSGTIYEAAQNYGIPVVLTVHGLLHEEKNLLPKSLLESIQIQAREIITQHSCLFSSFSHILRHNGSITADNRCHLNISSQAAIGRHQGFPFFFCSSIRYLR